MSSTEETAICHDGLQNLDRSFAKKKANPGFFLPLFAALQQHAEHGPGDFSAQLETFLSREDISMRSDDDKTLVLAMRIPG